MALTAGTSLIDSTGHRKKCVNGKKPLATGFSDKCCNPCPCAMEDIFGAGHGDFTCGGGTKPTPQSYLVTFVGVDMCVAPNCVTVTSSFHQNILSGDINHSYRLLYVGSSNWTFSPPVIRPTYQNWSGAACTTGLFQTDDTAVIQIVNTGGNTYLMAYNGFCDYFFAVISTGSYLCCKSVAVANNAITAWGQFLNVGPATGKNGYAVVTVCG